MDVYNIDFKPSVEKDLDKLPNSILKRVWKHFEKLKTNPFPVGSLKLSAAEKLYRIRIGDYRIVYDVNTISNIVMIHYVRHRNEVYRTLR